MRLVRVFVIALVLAGCGSAEQTNVPASSKETSASASGEGTTVGQQADTTDVDESKLNPPPVVLVSEAGKQIAVRGSSCVIYTGEASGEGQGLCTDTGVVRPDAVTVVQPRDKVTILVVDSTLKKERTVTVRPLGCSNRKTKTLELPATGELRWQVDLAQGAYQLDVFAQFESNDGRSGDLSGTLGLLVGGGPKSNDYGGVLAIKPAMHVCAFTD